MPSQFAYVHRPKEIEYPSVRTLDEKQWLDIGPSHWEPGHVSS